MKTFSDTNGASILSEQPGHDRGNEHGGLFRYEVVTVGDAIEKAAAGRWDLPNFQRRFVWTPWQVCNLADSLWAGYPIGAVLLWRGAAADPPADEGNCQWRVVDGHHRLTSLCLLAGSEPRWLWGESRRANSLFRRYGLHFDASAPGAPRFRTLARSESSTPEPHLIPVSQLFSLYRRGQSGQEQLEELVARAAASHRCGDLDHATLRARLERACNMSEQPLLTMQFNCERADVVEIVQRLASGGMRFRKLLLKLLFEALDTAAGRKHAVLGPG
jgi:Protein of unknown function DUF262